MLPDILKDHAVAAALDAALPDAITGGHAERNELTLWIEPARIVDVCRFLKDDAEVRAPERSHRGGPLPAEPRFEVVYQLHSVERNQRLRLKCRLAEAEPEIESVTACGAPPTGMSAKSSICSASAFAIIPICAAS